MTLKFEFVQDFRKYRDYITYITKVDEAVGKLPFLFYQGDMLDCFVVERLDDVVTVTMSNNTAQLMERFNEDAQPDTFESIPEGVAYIYDIKKHELIYNFDTKDPNNAYDWSSYPDVFWMTDEEAHDHGLVIGADGKLCRMYLSNKKLIALFVSLNDLNFSFPTPVHSDGDEAVLEGAGVSMVLSILASQVGEDAPKMTDVRTAIACDLVAPTGGEYAKYDFSDLIRLFENQGDADEWESGSWRESIDNAMARDGAYDRSPTAVALETYADHLNVSELMERKEVPLFDRITYVHMDVPIHGVHYMIIQPDQTLDIFFDNLIIREEDLVQHFANLPQEQLHMQGDYDAVDDDLDALDKSGTVASEIINKYDKIADGSTSDRYTDEELGLSGGRH